MKRLQGFAVLLGLLVLVQPAHPAELKIFGSRVTKVIVGELGPQFEKARSRLRATTRRKDMK